MQGQGKFDLGLDPKSPAGLWKSSVHGRRICGKRYAGAYQVLGLDSAAGGDEVFRDLALARIIEPTSKADSLRVLAEAGVEPVSYRTLTRHLPYFAQSFLGSS